MKPSLKEKLIENLGEAKFEPLEHNTVEKIKKIIKQTLYNETGHYLEIRISIITNGNGDITVVPNNGNSKLFFDKIFITNNSIKIYE